MTKQKKNKTETGAMDENNTSLSKARFNELLQQAVDETTVDTTGKSRRRRKKKLDDTVLDKIRMGEGLKKEEDQTLLANVYDPDDVKGEKSNKRRERAREQRRENGKETGHANIGYLDETGSPRRKKKGHKDSLRRDGTLEDQAPPASLGKKKKKKKINTEPDIESEGVSTAELASAEQTPAKKISKKKKKVKYPEAAEEQASQSEDPTKSLDDLDPSSARSLLSDTTAETSKTKLKKKKKKKIRTPDGEGETQTQDEAECQSLPTSVEDDGRAIGIIVHRTDKLKTDFYVCHPLVRVHIINLTTGNHMKKQHKDRAVTSYYEKDNKVDFILPIMTFPFDFKQNTSVLPMWEETLVFNENYNYILQDEPNAMIFFELLDFVSINTARLQYERDKQAGGWHRIAWAFLKVVGSRGVANTEHKVRLQLYRLPPNFKPKADQNEVFQWYNAGAAYRVRYPSTLYVTVKGLVLDPELTPASRSLFATQAEKGQISYDEMQKNLELGAASKQRDTWQNSASLWSRLQGQVCKVPNALHFTLPVSRKGCFVVSFSPDGRSLACACHDNDGFPIVIYKIPEGVMKGQMCGHYGIIYDLHWSLDSKLLMSASSDGTARVWDGVHVTQTPVKLLPHPSYVYGARFHVRVQKVIVTGSYDRIIRVWSIQGSEQYGELIQELDGHLGHINALCFDEDGTFLYSGDSLGQIRVWNAYCTDQPSKKGVLKDWTKNGEINEPEMAGTSINSMTLHPNGRRLLVHCRDNVIRMIDLRIRSIMQRYHGALNFREQIRSTISPCGTFIVSGSEDSSAYIWNAEAGDRVASYKELGYKAAVTDVAFHPHDHMVAFCSYAENHPVLIYKYDHAVAQRDAGIECSIISLTTQPWMGRPSSPEMVANVKRKAKVEERPEPKRSNWSNLKDMDVGTIARMERVQHKLEAVTGYYPTLTPDHPLGLHAHTASFSNSMNMTYGSTFNTAAWHNQIPSDTDTMSNLPPSVLSPHAGLTSLQASITQQQQLMAESEYQRVGKGRPGFSALGAQGNLQRLPGGPIANRAPVISGMTHQGKPQFSFASTPEERAAYQQVVALYNYQSQRSDELTLERGDTITVIYKDNENWWMGELANGQQGFFPANYTTGHSDTKIRGDSDAELLNEFKTSDHNDNDEVEEETKIKERMAAIVSRSGQLEIFSMSATESDTDGSTLKKKRTKKKGLPTSSFSLENEMESGTPKKTSMHRKKKKATIMEETEA